ncbi:response regulator [Cohnella sp. GCM10027633]|uniref:response regulator transcription factor n=1 Tax=unclassified Cohnella TaxID=2636738 RepID=UPI00363C3E6A
MIRVLIVDDEIYAVKGLRSGVRWDEIGVDEVHEAYHAPMAQDILNERDIDILLCDIEMPETSGLDLMAWIKERGMDPETIVLTCHSEFAYAQRAMHLGGFDYLLKPVVYTELEQVLRTAIGKVNEKRRISETDEQYGRIVELWNSRKPLLVERFWQDLLECRIPPSEKAIAQSLAAYDMRMADVASVSLVLVSVERWEKPLNDRDEQIMEFALRKAAEEVLLEGGLSGDVIQDHRGNLLAILHRGTSELPQALLTERCGAYLAACNEYFFCQVSCYVGEPVAITDIVGSYMTLLDAEYRNVNQSGIVVTCGSPDGDGGIPIAAPMTESALDLAELIEQGRMGELETRLDAWTMRLAGGQPTVETLTASYHAFLQAVYYAMHRRGMQAHLLYENRTCPGIETATRSVAHWQSWARCIAEAAGALFAKPAATSPVVQKVTAFIGEHLDDDLTREQLAAVAFVNPAYLSRLFRKETGMVLTDYILQEKMRKAAELLSTTDRSISEIADGLSYGNFSYFARLFRKVHGVTPHDYRKSYRKRA